MSWCDQNLMNQNARRNSEKYTRLKFCVLFGIDVKPDLSNVRKIDTDKSF